MPKRRSIGDRFTQAEAIGIFLRAAPLHSPAVVVAAGEDDCGVLRITGSDCIVVTSDYTNFRPVSTTLAVGGLFDRGFLLVQHNVSDLLATGATPVAFLASIGLPAEFSRREIEALAQGIASAVRKNGMVLIGGDTKEASAVILCGMALGQVARRRVWIQSAARPGDDLYLSGRVGGVSAAILLSTYRQAQAGSSGAARALLRPRLPLTLAAQLRRRGFRIAATDISDGLGADLTRLLRRSGVGGTIWGDSIPIEPFALGVARRQGLHPLELAFGLGGDCQFVFSAAPVHRAYIEAGGATRIGRLHRNVEMRLYVKGEALDVPEFGHRDFDGRDSIAQLLDVLGSRFSL